MEHYKMRFGSGWKNNLVSKSKKELIEILEYWINRSKSNTYSVKLNLLIDEQVNLILKFPEIGRETDIPNVYIKSVKRYLIYYEVVNHSLHILTIRDDRRDPATLKIK